MRVHADVSACAPLGAAQDSAANEIVWKANFLAKSASFVDWPVDSALHAANSFRCCVYGIFSFGTTLAEMTRDITVNGKRAEVKWIHKAALSADGKAPTFEVNLEAVA